MGRSRLRILIALTVFSALGVPAASQAAISNLFVFGDSIVDTGNLQAALFPFDPTPAAVGYFDGRFTNGPNVADLLNNFIEGTNAVGSLFGGDNYAFGGARARTDADGIPDLALQIGGYLLGTGGLADPGALYFINAGGNDIRDILIPSITSGMAAETIIDDAVAAIAAQVGVLQAAGATKILVAGAGNVGGTPEQVNLGLMNFATGRIRSEQFNDRLFAALPATVRTFDTLALADAVFLNPGDFGLPNPYEFFSDCLGDGAGPICPNHAWFDLVHPTADIHEIFGNALIATLVPLPPTLWMLGPALVAMATLGRSRRAT